MTQRCRKGFTLVELLVVIGIIALLVSILLPALQSARRAAATVKCGTAMREVGNAFQMYAQENKGYAPASRLFGTTVYNINGTDYQVNVTATKADGTTVTSGNNAYWFSFLAKYVTKTKMGFSGKTAGEASEQLKSIFWSCPAWDPYIVNGIGVTGFQQAQTGLGMNGFPEYQPDFPTPGVSIGDNPDDGSTPVQYKYMVNTPDSTNSGNWSSFDNKWYKLNKWTHPSERALVGDCIYWFMEARSTPANVPPNPWTVGEPSLTNGNTWTGTNPKNQTTFDYYRHGKYPPLKPGGAEFAVNGGKIGYNVLFADGHVATLTDRPAAYKSVRMKYPG